MKRLLTLLAAAIIAATAHAQTLVLPQQGGTGVANANTKTITLGGTGGNILYQTNTGAVTTLTNGTSGYVLQANGGTAAPSWVAAVPGAGTVTTFSCVTANGVSCSVADATTTPAATFTLGAITPTTVNGHTFTTGSSTFTGTAAQTYTFPTTSATLARTDAANTFTGHQTIEGVTSTGATGTGKFVFDTSPVFSSTIDVTGIAYLRSNVIAGVADTSAHLEAIQVDGGSTSGGGAQFLFRRNAVNKLIFGLESGIFGNNANNAVLYSYSDNVDLYGAGVKMATVTSTGLSTPGTLGVTGATTMTGALTNTAAAPQIILGANTTTLGSVKLFGNTSGDATVRPAAVAGTATTVTLPNASSTLPIYPQQITYTGPTAARTITLPDASFTVARTDAANTFTGVQTMTSAALTTPTVTNPALTVQALTDAATIAWNMNSGNMATVSVGTAGRAIGGPTNIPAAGSAALRITYSGSGTVTSFNSVFKWAGGTAPTLSNAAGKFDMVTCNIFDGTNLLCAATLDVR